MRVSDSYLKQLIDRIYEEGSFVLASPEDADYFRSACKKRAPLPPPPSPKPEKIVFPPEKPLFEAPKGESNPLPAKQKEPPPSVKPQNKTPAEKRIDPPEAIASYSFSEMKKLFSKAMPTLQILDQIPPDDLARKLSEKWKTKNQSARISILSYQEPPEQRLFLEKIALALDVYFGPAKIIDAASIEKKDAWDTFLSVEDLQLVIVCDYTLWQLNRLLQFYKETPAQEKRVLKETPLFLLPDLSLYFKDPQLKRSLWRALCQKCT